MINTINTNSESANGTSPLQPTNAGATIAGKETSGQRKLTTRKTVAERLRLLKAKYEELVEVEGMKAGRKWAEQRAYGVELQRLTTCAGLWWGLNFDDGTELSAGERFFFTIRPDQDGDREAALAFWTSVTGAAEMPDSVFVDAFAETAAEVWEQTQE